MTAKNATHKLTDPAIRNAKLRDVAYNLPDGGGLGLEVQPSGAKWWRFRYRFDGKEKMLSLGTQPEVSLKDARERRHIDALCKTRTRRGAKGKFHLLARL